MRRLNLNGSRPTRPSARWRHKGLRTLASTLLLGLALVGHLQAEPTPAERHRIETLLATLASDTQHQFERSGSRYTGAQAARFLRAKWEAKGRQVRTAEEFVEHIASRSTTTGKVYRVCTPTDNCVPAGEHLRGVLKGL